MEKPSEQAGLQRRCRIDPGKNWFMSQGLADLQRRCRIDPGKYLLMCLGMAGLPKNGLDRSLRKSSTSVEESLCKKENPG